MVGKDLLTLFRESLKIGKHPVLAQENPCAFEIAGKFNKLGINQYTIKSTGIMYKIRELILLGNLGTVCQKIRELTCSVLYTAERK
jgi:hypothetical protein